ncbi:MAG: transporter [Pseudomonadota bacterium]
MATTLAPTLVMCAVVGVTLIGDYYVKLASLKGGLGGIALVAGSGFYMASAVGLMFAMRHWSLASVGVAYAVLTILAMTGLGVFVFGEKLSAREIVGVLLAFASLACVARFV